MQIFMLFLFTLIIPCAFCGNEETMKNGEKKSQAVGPSKANGTSNFLKTAAVGGLLAFGGGIGLANGAQPAAPSGASFNNNLTTATNQHLFKPSNGYVPPPMKPFVEYKQPADEPSQSSTTSDERRQLSGSKRHRHHHHSSATKAKTPFSYFF